MVLEVGEDLKGLGFEIDCSDIEIEVRSADAMVALFNQISDEARHDVKYHTPFGPFAKNQRTTFRDGDGSRLAFYDPNSKAIVFKAGSLGMLTKGYLAHELAHAYQDQTWGFDTIWEPYHARPSREAFNVTQFIIEGHAELVRHAYEQNSVPLEDAKEISVTLGKMSENDCIPCHTKQSLSTLPYVFGMRFLINQYRNGGWPQVESFFTDLPTSTEQIIHENKFAKDHPTNLSLPEWKDESFKPQTVLNGSLGEAFLLAKLLTLPISPEQAFSSASGWDGDVAQIYRLPDGREAFVWRLLFDRVFDASQFEDAVKDFGTESSAFRLGRVVDWIVTEHADIKRSLRLFLGSHPTRFQANRDDELSTTEQEKLIKDDAKFFNSPYFVPKVTIDSKQ